MVVRDGDVTGIVLRFGADLVGVLHTRLVDGKALGAVVEVVCPEGGFPTGARLTDNLNAGCAHVDHLVVVDEIVLVVAVHKDDVTAHVGEFRVDNFDVFGVLGVDAARADHTPVTPHEGDVVHVRLVDGKHGALGAEIVKSVEGDVLDRIFDALALDLDEFGVHRRFYFCTA